VFKSYYQQPRLLDSLGFHVEPYRYDSAIPTSLDVDRAKLRQRRNLPGIIFDEKVFFQWLERLQPFAEEFAEVPPDYTEGAPFWRHNGGFEDFDAVTLYAMIRLLKPRRFIEVGCGFSTRAASMALRRNTAESHACEALFIEPYPSDDVRRNPPPGPLLERKIQDVPLSTFQDLRDGDILFIDTTHIVKAQSDCVYELLEVLPTLQAGVHVHLHDIFTPFDYPAEWLLDHLRPFNEQYALECLLTDSKAFQVILPVHFLYTVHHAALDRLLPGGETRPASFWMRRQPL